MVVQGGGAALNPGAGPVTGVRLEELSSNILPFSRNGVICETMIGIIIDINVLVSALKSDMGASYALISTLPSPKIQFSISVPLYIEYQDVLTRKEHLTGSSTEKEILVFLKYLCKIANRQKIFYLWRPWLKDPKDDMVLELAVAANSNYIVTYNLKDFSNIQKFGIEAITPGKFLQILKEV